MPDNTPLAVPAPTAATEASPTPAAAEPTPEQTQQAPATAAQPQETAVEVPTPAPDEASPEPATDDARVAATGGEAGQDGAEEDLTFEETAEAAPEEAPAAEVGKHEVDTVRLARDFRLKEWQVKAVVELLDADNTIPFITRYRKERTGGLNEVVLRDLQNAVTSLRRLADRRETVLRTIENQGKLTDRLRKQVADAETFARLEDLYLPFKPRKQTLADLAAGRGLGPVADAVFADDEDVADLPATLERLVDPDRQLATADDVRTGIGHILAQRIAEDPTVRERVRRVYWQGRLVSQRATPKASAQPKGRGGNNPLDVEFRNYFDFAEAFAKLPPHRVMALNRGEKQGVLRLTFEADREQMREAVHSALPLEDHRHAKWLRECADDALDRLLRRSLETEVRRELSDAAEAHAIDVFARNLKNLLLQPPVRGKRVLAIDPGFKNGCKWAVLDEFGGLLEEGICYPHVKRRKSKKKKKASTVVDVTPAAEEPKDFATGVGEGDGEDRPEAAAAGADASGADAPGADAASPAPAAGAGRQTEAQVPAASAAEPVQQPGMPAPEAAAETPAAARPRPPEEGGQPSAPPVRPMEGACRTVPDDGQDPPEHPKADEDDATPPPAEETPDEAADDPPAVDPEAPSTGEGINPQGGHDRPAEPDPKESDPSTDEIADADKAAAGDAAEGDPPAAAEPGGSSVGAGAGGENTGQASGGDSGGAAAAAPKPSEPAKPRAPQLTRRDKAKLVFAELCRKHRVDVIAIGNGTACRETEELVGEMLAGDMPGVLGEAVLTEGEDAVGSTSEDVHPGTAPDPGEPSALPPYVVVNEAGASVYSASDTAREEFPKYDATLRGTISIGRRLQDPLSELVKIDPQNIGVGQYQHDVSPRRLEEALKSVVESCVNFVGVDLNSASAALLRYVAGMNAARARSVVEHRERHGPFRSRAQLTDVTGIGPKVFTQSAGFLKLPEGEQPLDNTWVHPERYDVAERILQAAGAEAVALRQPEALEQLRKGMHAVDGKAVAEQSGDEVVEATVYDIMESLARPGRDPRESFTKPVFRKGILKLEELTPGMELTGTVLNVVDFGLFVDVGLKESGLVHISQVTNRFLSTPHEAAAVGDVVRVWVIKVDEQRGRVSLTMVPPGTPPAERRPRRGGGNRQGGGGGGGRDGGAPREGDNRGGGRDRGRGGDRSRGQGGRGGPGGGRDRGGRGGGRGGGGQGKMGVAPLRGDKSRLFTGGGTTPSHKVELSDEALKGKEDLHTFGELKAFFDASDAPKKEQPRKTDGEQKPPESS